MKFSGVKWVEGKGCPVYWTFVAVWCVTNFSAPPNAYGAKP
nr:MAG TPA: hypothetical protein [Caudoviricetes sp.]